MVTSVRSIRQKRAAKRDDEHFFYVGAWEYQNNDETAPVLNKEPLEYEIIKVQTRNYKN